MTNRWNEATTVQFVQLYRDHENLWNMFNKEYRNREVRSASMQAIVDDMNILNFTANNVPKKIKSLRLTYYLELAKVEKSKASGGGADFVYKPSVAWFTDMDHIMKTANLKEKETTSNSDSGAPREVQGDLNTVLESDNEVVIDDYLGLEERSRPISRAQDSRSRPTPTSDRAPQNISRSRNKGQKKRLETITDAVRELKDLNDKLHAPTTTTVSNDDECDIMGKHYAIQLRQLPTDDRVRANFEIQRVLMEYRLKNTVHVPSSLTSSDRASMSSLNSVLDMPSGPSTSQQYLSEDSCFLQVINTDIIKEAMTSCDISYI